MRATEGRVGGRTPQPQHKINSLNNRLTLCNLCEVSQVDRKYSPKTGLVVLTNPVFASEEGGL